MAKISADRAARGRTSGKSVGGVSVIKESAKGGMRKIRCPKSQQLATPTRRADGTVVYRTPNGVEYTTKKF